MTDGPGTDGPDRADAARAAAVARFVALVAAGDPPLDRAALEIATAADPAPDPRPAALAELDRLADGLAGQGVDALVERLWRREGFAGDTENYYDPRNSSLAQVLARRRGIPITLAAVAIEVGRRAGIALEPIGMPGHFLLRRPDGDHLDPFTGRRLDLAACEALFRASTGAAPGTFSPTLLAPVPVTPLLVRMLTNLRLVHRRLVEGRAPLRSVSGPLDDLAWVLDMRLALPGVEAGEVTERATVHGRHAEYRAAADLLDAWAPRLPDDAPGLQRLARTWRARLN